MKLGKNANINFALGLSKPLNIFKNSLKIMNYSLQVDFYLHTSITYPVNAFIFKNLISKKLRDKAKLITKILGDDPNFLIKTLELSFKRFGKKNIDIIQITNLPLKKNGIRNCENLDNQKFSEIVKIVNKYKFDNKINKVFLQLYYDDNIKLIEKVANDFDGFVFQGSKENIFINENIYDFLITKKVPLIIFSVFGGGEVSYNDTFNFFTQNFNNDLILVGRTSNFDRLKIIYNSINSKKTIEKKMNVNFFPQNKKQEVSKLFLKTAYVSDPFYSIKVILKDFVKKILKINK